MRIALILSASGLIACEHTTNFGTDSGLADGGLDGTVEELDASEVDASEIDASGADSGLSLGEGGVGQPAPCGNHVCACSDGMDNDKDGFFDGLDSECTGAFDDYEDSFRVNDVRGGKKCSDCFFDGNPGAGDDRCDVSTHCTVDGTFLNSDGTCKTCEALPACEQRCVPITPNGCDCFGCCEVIYEGAPVPIRLVGTCDMKKIADANACPSCVINKTCFNPCDACDLCPGKTLADLPKAPCMNGVDCGMDRAPCKLAGDCSASEYCGQGCCLPILY